MKKLIYTLLFCYFSLVLNATVITVSNNPLTAGQYTVLSTAVAAASNGDTIYVHGSPNAYGDITLGKKLTIIGPGYAVSGTQFNLTAVIGSITLNPLSFGLSSSGSNFMGLYISGTISSATGVTNIHVFRCYINSLYLYDNNWIIENNVINYLNIYYSPVVSCLIRNNFFVYYLNGASSGYVMNGLLIDHNIFEYQISNLKYALISNNIFFNANQSSSSGVNNCTFSNNITLNNTSDVLPYGTNTGGGNINNINPSSLFIGGMSTFQNFPALTAYDWHLKTTSAGHNAGTDTTDIGIYGGSTPMPNLTGAPSIIPQMTLMNINNASIPINSSLNVRFKARKQN